MCATFLAVKEDLVKGIDQLCRRFPRSFGAATQRFEVSQFTLKDYGIACRPRFDLTIVRSLFFDNAIFWTKLKAIICAVSNVYDCL